MKARSLVRRTIMAVLVIEAISALCFAGGSIWHERRIRLGALDVTLEGRSDSLIGAVQDAEDPADNVKIDPEEFKPSPGDVYAVYNPDGRLVGASPLAPAPLVVRGKDGFRDLWADGHHYRVLQRQAIRIIDREENGGIGYRRPVVLIYATRSDHLWREVLDAARFYLLLSVTVLGITALLLVMLLGQLLRPLSELASAASRVNPSALEFVPSTSAFETKELRPLAEALSQTMTRLRTAFENEKQFMSDAAHELKTAVAVVRSSLQVLTMRERNGEEYRHGLDQVLEDNARVEELVARMLMLSRFAEAPQRTENAVDLSEHVGAVVQRLSSLAAMHDVAIDASLDTQAWVLLMPEAAQVLASNLIMNAVQHSRAGERVKVSVGPSESRRIVLTVEDCGSGIAAENLPHVFERFFREDPSRARATGGAGLGLAICKSIVESAGGEISIRSRKGEGTTVSAVFTPAGPHFGGS